MTRLVHCGFVIVLFALASCGQPIDGNLDWKEEVTLSSGEKFFITRTQRLDLNVANALTPGNHALDSRVASATDRIHFPEWRAPMIPLLLDRDPANGDWILVATNATCRFWQRNQQPAPPYWAFRAVKGEWKRTEMPAGFWNRPTNLFAAFNLSDSDRTIAQTLRARKLKQLSGTADSSWARIFPRSTSICPRLATPAASHQELDLLQFRDP